MTAQENLSPRQFFHGTRAKLRPGDLVEPGHAPANSPDVENHVYFTGDPAAAADWGPRVYAVEPTGKHQRDPHAYGGGDYRSKSPLKVLHTHAVIP